ncbi:hypothetical protein WL77_20605 [Burkholderia ubonensis]|nr:hypothetical protein WL77_20605 [Burkholderia ubonensis]KWE79778.1 hypothetical protein WL79_04125 [Burkholderia ubonensis]
MRTVEVSRRPRVCVVVASYDLVPSACERQPWQRPDANGPYLCALLKQWGCDASLEYVAPPDMTLRPLESRDAELAFRRQLAALAQRYDLLVGTGVLADDPHQDAALNRLPVFPVSEARVMLPQVRGARFNFGRSEDRLPAQRRTFELTDAAGRPGGSRVVTYFDQATLVNLPGYPGDVAILAHTILRRLIDLLEFADTPGPYWETGVLGAPTSRDPARHDLRWATLAAGAAGEPVVTPLAGERADALVAIEPEPGIRGDWYNLKWIPLTHNGSGDHLCVDLDPDEGGRIGQVIRVWHDSPERELVAKRVGEWLARGVPG